MRTAGASFQTHLGTGQTSLSQLLVITRKDGTVYRFTDANANLVVSSNTYKAAPNFTVGTLNTFIDGTVSSIEVTMGLDGDVTQDDINLGLYDGARFQLYWVNHADTSMGTIIKFDGLSGEIDLSDSNLVTFEVRSLMSRAKAVFSALTGPGCRADLGSTRYPFVCGLPLIPADMERSTAYVVGDTRRFATAGDYQNVYFECTTAGTTAGSAPTFDYFVGNTTTDGTAVWTARNAWVRSFTVATVTDALNATLTLTEPRAVDDWFTFGMVIWSTGNLAGTVSSVRKWVQSTAAVSIWHNPGYAIQVGDTGFITPGCDKNFATCRDKFSNKDNFQGEPDLPVRRVA